MGFPVSATIKAASIVGSALFGSSAERAEERARRAQGQITQMQNRQRTAAFLQNFVLTQAAEQAGNIGAGAGFESSRFQGQTSSLETQARINLTDAAFTLERGQYIDRQLDKAGSARRNAGIVSSIGNFARMDGVRDFLDG